MRRVLIDVPVVAEPTSGAGAPSVSGSGTPAPAPSVGDFDPSRPWRRARSVALRPEPFGALVYHFGNRRLSFLKSKALVAVVETLAEHPSAEATEAPAVEEALVEESLVEEVSIDGMCGVY